MGQLLSNIHIELLLLEPKVRALSRIHCGLWELLRCLTLFCTKEIWKTFSRDWL